MRIGHGCERAAAFSGRAGSEPLLLAVALGLAALGARPPLLAQQPALESGTRAPRADVVITATKEADALLTAKVEKALEDDRWLYAPHIDVVTEHGVVKLQGMARDASELNRALMLARRAARGRRVVDEVELYVVSEDNDK
jgi:hypothetical protein